jgi:hypothetical protein
MFLASILNEGKTLYARRGQGMGGKSRGWFRHGLPGPLNSFVDEGPAPCRLVRQVPEFRLLRRKGSGSAILTYRRRLNGRISNRRQGGEM